MNYKKIKFTLFFVVLLFLIPISINAQNFRDRKDQDFGKRWGRIEEFKKLKMIEELKLSDEESVKFYSKYNQLTSQFKEIETERRKAINDLEKIVNDPSRSAELEKKIDYIESLEQRMLNNRLTFMSEIRKILSLDKVARYIVFERNFQRELQRIVRDAKKPPFER